jgi:rare lipoprotein A
MRSALLVAAMCGALSSCAKKKTARAPAPPPRNAAPTTPAKLGATERGEASWYGEPYNGRRAASGEIFDMEQLTAAHRSLPFQTWVEVTNLTNGKHVDVRITDRGPFVDGRIIDLSRAAAREIDMLRAGIAPVELRVIEAPVRSSLPASPPEPFPPATPASAPGGYAVQVGAFRDRSRAEALAASLLLPDVFLQDVRVVPGDSGTTPWRVWVGADLTMDSANALARKLQDIVDQAFVVRLPR